MDISQGQKKAGGELVVDMREIQQEAQNNNQGGVVSKSIDAFKHLGKLLKAPFIFSAPPSDVVDFAKKVNGKLYGKDGLAGILDDPANAGVLGKTSPANPLIPSLQTQFGTAEQTRSPLILDLDGVDGAETPIAGSRVTATTRSVTRALPRTWTR